MRRASSDVRTDHRVALGNFVGHIYFFTPVVGVCAQACRFRSAAKSSVTFSSHGETRERPAIRAKDAGVSAGTALWDELIARGKEKGFVLLDDVNRAMPPSVKSTAQISRWLEKLDQHGIDVRTEEPAPLRTYDEARVQSARRTGRAIGPLFAQNLLDLATAESPTSFPCGGVYCPLGEAKYRGVHFPDGLTADVGRWLASPKLADAALISFGYGRVVTLGLGACDGTTNFDLTCRHRVEVKDGRTATSTPRYELNRVGPDVYEAFMDGVRSGMAEHVKASEIGFGALGSALCKT
jgi:hypothetical protein